MFRTMRDKEYATARETIMARAKSEFLSAFGIAFQVFKALTDEVLNLGGSDQDIRRIETDSQLRRKIAELVIDAKQVAENCYRVVVDYGQTLQQMIANGRYDCANSDINADNFPISGNGKENVVIELVHFGQDMGSEAVLKEFEARGLRAATLPKLLAFGVTYPEKQREFPIVALGSVWQSRSGCRYVPYLRRRSDERRLSLCWVGGRWFGSCRFAVVRK